MKVTGLPSSFTDWSSIEPTVHPGDSGTARWWTREWGDLRIRIVEYSADYLADHWCARGHVIHCLEGEFDVELEDGRVFAVEAGMSCQLPEETEPHRTRSRTGARLFIVD